MGKNGTQHTLIWKNGAQPVQNHMMAFFWRSSQKRS